MIAYHVHLELAGESDPESYGHVEPYLFTADEVIASLTSLGFVPGVTIAEVEAQPADGSWNVTWNRPTSAGVLHVSITKIEE